MEQIRLGHEKGLDVSVYAKPELSWEEMKEIREKMERLPIEVIEEAKGRCKERCERKRLRLTKLTI